MYEQLNGAGFACPSSSVICRNTDNGEVVFFDAMGTQSQVMALTSDFLEAGKFGCNDQDGYSYHGREKMLHYKREVRPVPKDPKHPQASDAWVHAIVMLKIFGAEVDHEKIEDWFPSPGMIRFGVLVEEGEDPVMGFYLRLRKFIEKTPLSAEWRQWLFRLFDERRWMHECATCFGSWKAWIVFFEEAKLQDAISAAIQARELEVCAIFGEEGMMPIEAPVEEIEEDVLDYHAESYIKYGRMQVMPTVYGCATEENWCWFLDIISSYQMYPAFSEEPFQVWQLMRIPETSCFMVTCHDGNGVSCFKTKFGEVVLLGEATIPMLSLLRVTTQYDCNPMAFRWMRQHLGQIEACQLVPYGDFKEDTLKLYLEDGVLIFPEEH